MSVCGKGHRGSTVALKSVLKNRGKRTSPSQVEGVKRKTRKSDIIKRIAHRIASAAVRNPQKQSSGLISTPDFYIGRNKPASPKHWKTWPPEIPTSQHRHRVGFVWILRSTLQSGERWFAQLTHENQRCRHSSVEGWSCAWLYTLPTVPWPVFHQMCLGSDQPIGQRVHPRAEQHRGLI